MTAITREAFVTRSAVRRFCNRLGYPSLSALKDSFLAIRVSSDLSHREAEMTYGKYRAELDVRMIEMFAEVESRVSDAVIEHLADEIERRSNVEIWCTNNVSGNLTRFQAGDVFRGQDRAHPRRHRHRFIQGRRKGL